ncbi:cytochrome c oxidase subunit II [Halovenus rubra]|uniref:Cytochrome c oxidase subunit II n=2 Tax=Halovenus rubra TaxID=869890 RepID=A0ACC7DUZ7_9EURY|nr:cytochrome c oxidase subunit II [Halovenus rubra]
MVGSGAILTSLPGVEAVATLSRTQVDIFSRLFLAFVVLGTTVGVVVISYLMYNAYKYRTDAPDADGKYDVEEETDDDVVRPQLGEIPTSAKGGKKLFLSFGLSAVLVLGLIIYSYSLLLYVEDTGDVEPDMEVNVEGFQFAWAYEYDNGFETTGELVVPNEEVVGLEVSSRDVMHNFGIRGLRAKTDAMPGQTTETWFQADESGEYQAICFELCGSGHSNMREEVLVVPTSVWEQGQENYNFDNPDEFEQWYDQTIDAWKNGEFDDQLEVTN